MAAFRKIDAVSKGHEHLIPAGDDPSAAPWVIYGLLTVWWGTPLPDMTGPLPYKTVAEAITEAVRSGGTQRDAAGWAGIWPETLTRWLNRGHTELTRMATEGHETPRNTEEPYVNLALDVAHAEAAFKMGGITQWVNQFPGEWRAIQRFYERRYRSEWGPERRAFELSGPGGGPVPVAAVTMSADEAELLLAEADARGALESAESGSESPVGELGPGEPAMALAAPESFS